MTGVKVAVGVDVGGTTVAVGIGVGSGEIGNTGETGETKTDVDLIGFGVGEGVNTGITD